MPQTRTDSGKVGDILGDDWDRKRSLTRFIATANVVVNQVSVCAARRELPLDAQTAELLESWLAAHYYKCSDQQFAQETTDDASAIYTGKTDKFLERTTYGNTALRLDISGCLEAFDKRKVARGFWAGTHEHEGWLWPR
jgi:hypothetical protein